jgi:hypothetical protein
VTATFPEENVFGRTSAFCVACLSAIYITRPDVINGERNKMLLLVENNSEQNITLLNAGGSINHPVSGALIKNVRVSDDNPIFES